MSAKLKEVLAQPAQEPVAWMYDWLCDGKLITGWIAHSESEIPKSMAFNIRPLYTVPPQPAQEPVAWMVYTLDGASVCVTDNPADFTPEHRALPLYTAPPQRTWVDLTDAEIDAEANSILTSDPVQWWRRLARAVLAKSKEMNNGT